MQPSVNKRRTETGEKYFAGFGPFTFLSLTINSFCRKPNMILLFLVENLRLWYTMST